MSRRRWILPVLVALLMRVPRGLARWHEDAWRYSVYPSQVLHKLQSGLLQELPFTFTGLHPPAWPLLHAVTELASPRPMWWLVESIVLSTGAVVLLARRSVLAALVLATAPVAVHYSAEVNQYALLTFALAGLWSTSTESAARVHRPVVAWGLLAGWTHILGAVAAALAVGTLPRRQRSMSLLVLSVGLLPLLPGVWAAADEASTFLQPSLEPWLIVTDLVGRFGVFGLLLPVLGGRMIRREPRLAVGVVGGAVVLGGFVVARVAAPHQFPYLLTLLPPLALLAVRAPTARRVLLPLVVVQAGWQLVFDGVRLQAIASDLRAPPRAIDVALDALEEPWTCPDLILDSDCAGDALVLLRPPGRNDDDKTRTSSVLWRIRPWWAAPRIQLPQVDAGAPEHRYGQPRLVSTPRGPFAVYVHDQVRPTLRDVFEQHPSVWLVISGVGPGASMLEEASKLGERPAQAIGPDHLLRSGAAGSGLD